MFILIMGVAGSGKTTVGKRLAGELGWSFFDADDFHSPENVRKMAAGIPLNDDDRRPWLEQLRDLIAQLVDGRKNAVLACSALKRAYRDLLAAGRSEVVVVYLKADPGLIRQRLSHRAGHYMPVALLESQFQALEEPENAITVPADWPAAKIVSSIRSSLKL